MALLIALCTCLSTLLIEWAQASVFPVSATLVLDSRRGAKHREHGDVDEEAGLQEERELDAAAQDGEHLNRQSASSSAAGEGDRKRRRGAHRRRREWARSRWLLLHAGFLVGLAFAPLLAHLFIRVALPSLQQSLSLPSGVASSTAFAGAASSTAFADVAPASTATDSTTTSSASRPAAGVQSARDPRSPSGRLGQARRRRAAIEALALSSAAVGRPTIGPITKSAIPGDTNAERLAQAQPPSVGSLSPNASFGLVAQQLPVDPAATATATATTNPPEPAALPAATAALAPPSQAQVPRKPSKPGLIDANRPDSGISGTKEMIEGETIGGVPNVKEGKLAQKAESQPVEQSPVAPLLSSQTTVSPMKASDGKDPLFNSSDITFSDLRNESVNSSSITPMPSSIPTVPTVITSTTMIPTTTTTTTATTTITTTTTTPTTTTTTTTIATTQSFAEATTPFSSPLILTARVTALPSTLTSAFLLQKSTTIRAAKELLRATDPTAASDSELSSTSAPLSYNRTSSSGNSSDYMLVFRRILAKESRDELSLFSLHSLLLFAAALLFVGLCTLPLLATCCCKSRARGAPGGCGSTTGGSAFRALGAYRALFDSRTAHGTNRLQRMRLMTGGGALCSSASIVSLLVSLTLAVYLLLEALLLFFMPLLEFRALTFRFGLSLSSDSILGQLPAVTIVSVFWAAFLIARVGAAALLQSQVPQERFCRRFSQSCFFRFLFCEALNMLRRPVALLVLFLLVLFLQVALTFAFVVSLGMTPTANAFGASSLSSLFAYFRTRFEKLDSGSHNVLVFSGALYGACLGLFVPLVAQLLLIRSVCLRSCGLCSHATLVQLVSVLCCVLIGAHVELRGVGVVAVAAFGLSLLLALLAALSLVCVYCCCSSSGSPPSSSFSSPTSSGRVRRSADEAESLSLKDYLCLCCFCFAREFRVRQPSRARANNGGGNLYRSLNAKSRTN